MTHRKGAVAVPSAGGTVTAVVRHAGAVAVPRVCVDVEMAGSTLAPLDPGDASTHARRKKSTGADHRRRSLAPVVSCDGEGAMTYMFAHVRGRDNRVRGSCQLPAMSEWDPSHLETLAEKMRQGGHKSALPFADHESLLAHLRANSRDGDVVITLGAGDIWKVGQRLLDALKERC